VHLEGHPSIEVRGAQGARQASWSGIMHCGHIWTCPVCSANLRAKRTERIAAALRGMGGRWVMLTITLRHRAGMRLDTWRDTDGTTHPGLLDGLLRAWRRTRQGGRIQRVWSDRVTASARGTECTFGGNGWHPHLHVLLRTQEWDDDERDALLVRWRREVQRVLGKDCRPDDLHGLHWSEPFDAAEAGDRAKYIGKLGLKLGLEVAGHGKTEGYWTIAERAAAGDETAIRLWHEFQRATKGRRMLELDDRASDAADKTLEDEAADKARDDDESSAERTSITVKRDDLRALRWLERSFPVLMALVLQAAEQEGRPGVEAWIAYAWSRWREACPPNTTGPPSWGPTVGDA